MPAAVSVQIRFIDSDLDRLLDPSGVPILLCVQHLYIFKREGVSLAITVQVLGHR